MKKTLIVYGTRKGATADTARVILDVLTKQFSYQIDVIDVKQLKKIEKNLEEYNNIIVGSSIVSGRWVSKVLRFLKKHDFRNQKIAVFLSAGGTLNKVNKYGISKEEAIKEAVNNYIDKYLTDFKFIPIAKTAFGGRTKKYNNWKRDDIVNWANELGRKVL